MRKLFVFSILLLGAISVYAENDPLLKVSKELAAGISRQKNAKVAVLGIPYFDNRKSDGPYLLSEKLTSLLSKDKRLLILERNHISDVLAELKLTETGLLDLKTAKKIGEALGAEVIVTGTLVDVNFGQTDMNTRAVLTSSGKIIAASESLVPRTWGSDSIEPYDPELTNPKTLRALAHSLVKSMKLPLSHSLAVMNFTYTQDRMSSGSYLIPERILTYVVQEGGTVIERRLLQKYFQEKRLQESGVVSAASIKSMASILGVDGVIVGSLSDLASGDTEVVARVIDIQTTKVLAAATALTPKLWRDSPRLPTNTQLRTPVPGAYPMLPDKEGPVTTSESHTLSDLDRAAARALYRPAPVPFNIPQNFME